MNSNLKNIATILILCTVALGGYYLFIKRDATELNLGGTASGELFVDVQKYIERKDTLSQVKLNTAIFNEPRFRSLVSQTTEANPVIVGRPNPFEDLYNVAQPD